MDRQAIVNRVLYEWDLLVPGEAATLLSQLPPKLVRWLGSNHPDNRTRKLCFRATGVKVGHGTVLNPNLHIEDAYQPLVTIGDRVAVAPGVTIIADSSPNNSRLVELAGVLERLVVTRAVTIEDDAWIGANAVLLPGVVVGRGAIVGAGAVVTRNVRPYTIVAGVPAREVRSLEG